MIKVEEKRPVKCVADIQPYGMQMAVQFEHTSDGDMDGATGLTWTDGDGVINVKFLNNKADLWTIAHEAVHVMQDVQDWIGGELDRETQAYVVGNAAYTMRSILRQYNSGRRTNHA